MQVTVDVVAMGDRAVAPLNLSEAGSWLCERHEDLTELVKRIGAWDQGTPVMWKVRNTIGLFDNDAHGTPAVQALLVMSPGEVGRLRLLATVAPRSAFGENVRFCVEDLRTFDAVGKELIEDWIRCVRIGVLG